jgi:hypothetical protein
MTIKQVATGFTAGYIIAAIMWASHAESLDSAPYYVFLFAFPIAILLWSAVFVVHIAKPSLPPYYFVAFGLVIPALFITLIVGVPTWKGKSNWSRLTGQAKKARLITVEDEILSDATGAIGIRLRFRIEYPMGLDARADQAPKVYLLPVWEIDPGFVLVRQLVVPAVSGYYPPGSYEITEDFLPAFMPRSLIDPKQKPASEYCIQWSRSLSREHLLSYKSTPIMFSIHIAGGASEAIKRWTTKSYLPADFYDTAVREGVADCVT